MVTGLINSAYEGLTNLIYALSTPYIVLPL